MPASGGTDAVIAVVTSAVTDGVTQGGASVGCWLRGTDANCFQVLCMQSKRLHKQLDSQAGGLCAGAGEAASRMCATIAADVRLAGQVCRGLLRMRGSCSSGPFAGVIHPLCFAHVRPCAQWRCGPCPLGFGVMYIYFFFFSFFFVCGCTQACTCTCMHCVGR